MDALPFAVNMIGLELTVIAVALFIALALGSFSLAVYVVKRIRQ